jgi:hypothetical protein
VFNFWEPLHFFQKGHGFQTWEVTPQFAIRSWAYILFHLPVSQIGNFLGGGQKVRRLPNHPPTNSRFSESRFLRRPNIPRFLVFFLGGESIPQRSGESER